MTSLASLHSEIISESDIASMPDRALVEFVGSRIVKFAMEIRPLVIEVHKRFMAEKKAGRKFVGYSNFDTFCEEFWKYSGRQIRNIINGTPTPAKSQQPQQRRARSTEKPDEPETAPKPVNPELVAKIQAHEKASRDLAASLKQKGIDGEVSRSKTSGKFHLVLRDLTAEQIHAVAASL